MIADGIKGIMISDGLNSKYNVSILEFENSKASIWYFDFFFFTIKAIKQAK